MSTCSPHVKASRRRRGHASRPCIEAMRRACVEPWSSLISRSSRGTLRFIEKPLQLLSGSSPRPYEFDYMLSCTLAVTRGAAVGYPNPIMLRTTTATQNRAAHTCGYAHVPSVWSVHANPTRAGRVCTPFAARLQLTHNPKIRNPNPNPIMFAHPMWLRH